MHSAKQEILCKSELFIAKKIDPSIQVQNQEAIDCNRTQPSHVLQ